MSKSEEQKKKLNSVVLEIENNINELLGESKFRNPYGTTSPRTPNQAEITIKNLSSDFLKLSEEYIETLEKEIEESLDKRIKVTNKLKLAILYKLGIIDHLRTFDSLKNNDRALSRLLHTILESGTNDTFQTYLSAERSGSHSSAPQNNPLSDKLKEEAEEILGKTDLTNSELKKYYPL